MKQHLLKFLNTEGSSAALVSRLTLALVILPHGLQKTLGLFGGHGFSGTMGFFTGSLGVPTLVAFLVIMGESVGAISLALGFFTRFCAASLILIMGGAAAMHFKNGFFMNWFGQQSGEGFEYHLLAIGLALSLVISGGGKWSLDGALAKRGKV
jgi:putative oxidoreductase